MSTEKRIQQVAEEEGPETKLTAFAYLRVSTRKQDEEAQKLQVSKYAETHRIEVLDWYVDHAVSGDKTPPMEREGFRDMFETLEGLQSDGESPGHVLVFALSRIGRNFWEMLDIIRKLEAMSPIISTSPREQFLQVEERSLRNLFIGILAWAAENEVKDASDRTLMGLQLAKEKGRHSGVVPVGYFIDHASKDCLSLGHDPHQCKVHGILQLTDQGRAVLDYLAINRKAKPRQVRKIVPELTQQQSQKILANVKKYGKGFQVE